MKTKIQNQYSNWIINFTKNKDFMIKDTNYFEKIFEEFKDALKKEGKLLPSVSQIALKHNNPYSILVSTLISLRTKDSVTMAASEKILSVASTPYELSQLDIKKIEELIFPAGFYKRKAVQLKEIGEILTKKYDGKVPSNTEDLMALPGVGIKTANLTLNLGFGINAICVDCHVHQIANRLGWIDTKYAENSVDALEKILPKKFWIPLNELLVSYGQLICTPVSPFCSKCPEQNNCPKNGVNKNR